MNLLDECKAGDLKLQNCQCSACSYVAVRPIENVDSDVGKPNSMHQLIKILPLGFPIVLEQTVTVDQKEEGNSF